MVTHQRSSFTKQKARQNQDMASTLSLNRRLQPATGLNKSKPKKAASPTTKIFTAIASRPANGSPAASDPLAINSAQQTQEREEGGAMLTSTGFFILKRGDGGSNLLPNTASASNASEAKSGFNTTTQNSAAHETEPRLETARASPRMDNPKKVLAKALKVPFSPSVVDKRLERNKTEVERMSFLQQRQFEEADWRAVEQTELADALPPKNPNTIESFNPGSKSRQSLWSEMNKSNWKQIKEKKINFLQFGITRENFNSIKIKPIKDPEELLGRSSASYQTPAKANVQQRKKTLTSIELFRKRKRGLQTLSSIPSPLPEEIPYDPASVNFISADLRGPIMPTAYYNSK